jgi:hypothetical protein
MLTKEQPTNGENIKINTPLELLAFKIPRKSFALVLLSLGGTIGTLGLTLISMLFLGPVIWNGTAMEKQSGVRIVQVSEGSKTNENINLSVPESDWAKNLASMVRLKTFADQAEDDLFNNKSILGLKWQDIAIILITLLTVGVIIILLGVTPDMVATAVNENLLNGTLQNAVKSIITPTGGAA